MATEEEKQEALAGWMGKWDYYPLPKEGISPRDWFAGLSLNALIEDINRPSESKEAESDSAISPAEKIARRAYKIADAMLEARKR